MQYNGIILINKPIGMTSHDVVAITRRYLRNNGAEKKIKVGHAGTLDPQAEGVLPICVGRATKFVDFLANGQKQYKATLRLGVTTDTQDVWGNVTQEREVTGTREEIEGVIREFVGDIKQVPPMYSAIKQNGKKLYELARRGVEVERAPRDVTIYGIEIISVCDNEVEMLVDCSKGTYIRTLCHDIGEKLGCGGVMSGLVRTKVGDFSLEECGSIQALECGDFEFVGTTVAIGKFDGVHVAHRELIRRACEGGIKTVALVIEPDEWPAGIARLTNPLEKAEKLRLAGANMVVSVPLRKVHDLSCEEFFEEYILKRLNAKRVAVGFNFEFGKLREGDIKTLGRLCRENGVELVVLPAMKVGGVVVSSSLIREMAKKGEDIAGFI